MFTKTMDKAPASSTVRKRYHLLPFFFALVCALTISPTKAHAQIIGDLEVNIPFQFYAGNAKLPAGKYIIRPLDNSDLTIMEISSADNSISALFDVQQAEVNSAPPKNELIFNKYGKLYFLSSLFDENNPNGSRVPESQYEKRVSKASAEAQLHVSARRHGQPGD
jgi:hypothetical protein